MKDDDKITSDDSLSGEDLPKESLDAATSHPALASYQLDPHLKPPVLLRASRVPAEFLPMPHLGQLQQHDPVITPSVSLQTKTEDDPQVTVEQPISESELKQSVPPGALPDDPDPRCGMGIFSLSENSPFSIPCHNHDAEGLLSHRGENALTRTQADDRFERAEVLTVENSPDLRGTPNDSGFARLWNLGQAHLLAAVARIGNLFVWGRR